MRVHDTIPSAAIRKHTEVEVRLRCLLWVKSGHYTSQQNSGYSITLSVRASTEGGISRPSFLAVLALMTKSYRAGISIGRSAGLAPFSILSTYTAIPRN